jgi:polyphosphate kinase
VDTLNLSLPDYYINRELSQVEFNARVLRQAKDGRLPLLERLKFLCISSTNLDEFFEIRVAGLKQRIDISPLATGPDSLSPAEVLRVISSRVHELVDDQYRTLNDELVPALHEQGIRFLGKDEWSKAQRKWLRKYFRTKIEALLSPTSLDPTRPIPRILNKSLCFILDLEGRDAFGRACRHAIVQAPRTLPRLIQLPSSLPGTGTSDFVFLSSVIEEFVSELFPGVKIKGCHQFRVTRNSDLYVDDEEVDDLLRALERELFESRYGAVVRLEIASDCSDTLADYLLEHFELNEQDLYRVDGPVNLNRLLAVYSLLERSDLRDPPFTPHIPPTLSRGNVFEAISKGDILLHHPFDSFLPVVDFVHQAAEDPDVLAIKHTLYRTTPDSPIVESLVRAARAGKEVTVIVELRARFDEAANIELATKLQEAGVHVVYGIVGYKTHSKMILVVRRESNELKRYVHLGTGNYHPATTKLYTDYGLLTVDEAVSEDVHQVFMQLTSLMKTRPLTKLYQSPFTLHDKLLELIDREIRHVESGKTGYMIAKVNALIEPKIIEALYRASIAGVHIDLIVRGVCCLRPNIPGVSDNIRVRSIVSRFLEHTRVYYFYNDESEEVYCSSADWMDRNFFRRIELMFPILDLKHRERIIGELDTYLADNTQSWILQPNGEYVPLGPRPGEAPVSAQRTLLWEATGVA